MACVCVARGSLWRLHLALHLFLLVILLPLVQFALLLRRKLHLSQELALGLALATGSVAAALLHDGRHLPAGRERGGARG
jgi:NhaP-type Na+/H+ or K+/H+ antiporter